MANLVIDIGNTLIKIAVFAHDELLFTTSHSSIDAETLFNLTDQYQVNKAIISSVRKEAESWRSA